MSTSSKKGAHYEDCLVHCLTSCTLTLSDREVKKDSDLHQKMEHDLTKKKNKVSFDHLIVSALITNTLRPSPLLHAVTLTSPPC